jgi:hypothetical protein
MLNTNTSPIRAGALRLLATLACCVAVAACEDGQGAVDVDVSSSVDMAPLDAVEDEGFADVMIPVAATPARSGLRLLPNATSLPGDNYVLVRPARGFGGPMSLEAALRSAAPLPAPFEYAIASDFAAATPGGVRYLARSPAEGVTCALAVGASGSSSVIMRNCVNGDVSLALAPIEAFGRF